VDIDRLHNEVLRAFNDSCVVHTRQYGGRGFCPSADVYFEEDTREIVVRFELPGMTMDAIELLVDRREIVIRGERTFPAHGGRVYQQVEMDHGPFERRVRLLVDVDPEVTTATYAAGILEVRLTLTPQDEGVHKVEIQTRGGGA